MSPWEKLLEQPHSREHFVQLGGADERSLTENVGRYLWEGLKRGEGALVIATAEHWEWFKGQLSRLGADTEALVREQGLAVFDAQETLSRFMRAGQPDWRLFVNAAGGQMRQVLPRSRNAGLRAYGEMVGLLWRARQFAAAIRLENLWNKLLAQSAFSLYCAYSIDVFGKEFQASGLDEILRAHTHLIPAGRNGHLESAFDRAMDEILGAKADGLRILIKTNSRSSWAIMPNAEAIVLWLRKNLPGQAEDIIARARFHYHALMQTGAPAAANG